MRLRFVKPVLILTLILALLLAWPLIAWFEETRDAVFAAWGMGLGNALLGLVSIELTLQRDNAVFMASFFGGMAIRIFLVLFTFAFFLMEGYDAMTLTFFLMGFYFAYMVLEIRYVVRVLSKRRGGMLQI